MDISCFKMNATVSSVIFVDSHCHLQLDPLFDCTNEVLRNAATSNVRALVVNGVCPGQDWERVDNLCSCPRDGIKLMPSFGLHPWWIEQMLSEEQSADPIATLCSHLSQQLREKLEALPNAGVGECGLDKVIRKRVSLDAQESVLRCHLHLAVKFQRPISLHCVGAWGRLFDIVEGFESHRAEEKGVEHRPEVLSDMKFCVVLHSCNKMPIDMFRRFQRLNTPVYYSFNGKQLDGEVAKLLAVIPQNRLLIETDSPDQMPVMASPLAVSTTISLPDIADSNCCPGTAALPLPPSAQQMESRWALNIKCNEPANIRITCQGVSAILDQSPDEVAYVTTCNALLAFEGGVT